MRRKDKVIKEALQIYQQEKKETLPVYQEEERDSFEDRIYEKIRKMDIPNPRRKAHMVSLAIMVVFVVAIGMFFMQYRNKNRVSNTTKMIEKLYQEGSTDGSKYGIDVLRGTIRQEKKEYIYLIRYLSSTQKNALRKVAYKKTSYTLEQKQGGKTGTAIVCYARAPYHNQKEKTWKVYQLSDRKSHCYYILKDKDENMAIAKYVFAWQGLKGKDVLKDKFAIQKGEDIRSVTLERYRARSKENTDRIVAVYTKEQEKANILQAIKKINQNSKEPKAGKEDGFNAHEVSWDEISSKKPADCYYLTIENRQKEKWILGVYCSGKECIFYQYGKYNTGDHFEVAESDLKWVCDWIKKADKEY